MMVESLSVMMHWFTRLGRQMRMACGRMIFCMDLAWETPSERAASIWPLSTDWMAPRKISER